MGQFNCIIVEDEPLAAEVLQDYISQVPFLNLQATCSDAIYALEVLKSEKVDVIFLDIHLPRLKGFEFLKILKRPPQVIVTSAYREYALDGYELNVVDYLLKPINFNRFLMAVNKLKMDVLQSSEILFSDSAASVSEKEHIYININKKRIKIYLDDILYVESKREYISIFTKEKSYLAKYQLSEFEAQLDKNRFLRVHRSFVVSRNKIGAFGAATIDVRGVQIPIGRSYKELVLSTLGKSI